MSNDAVVSYGTRFLMGFCLGIPLLAVDFLAVGVFQAVGKGFYSLCFAVMRKIILEIPAIIILNSFFPLYGLAYSQAAAECVMAVLAVITLTSLVRKISEGKLTDSAAHS